MTKFFLTASAAALMATGAVAGGIERTGNDYGVLFSDGTQTAFGMSFVNPSVSGKAPDGTKTGNVALSYTAMSASYKRDLNDKMSLGVFLNTPYGADASYEGDYFNGLAAEWDSKQFAAVLSYGFDNGFSVYGGARYVVSSADIAIPGVAFEDGVQENADAATAGAAALAAAGANNPAHPLYATYVQTATIAATLNGVMASHNAGSGILDYTAEGDETGDWGLILGAAYEIPAIALRVGLTWETAITHEFDTKEVLVGLGVDGRSKTEVEMPQSIALDFQTGVAEGTLVFGGIKWTEWSKWEVRTEEFEAITGQEITGYDDDTFTWKLGVGRQFNEKTSGFAQIRYEKSNGGVASRLSPTDGSFGFGIGGQYTDENMNLRGGVEYVSLGDAKVGDGTSFEDNSAFGLGLSLTVSF